MHDASIDWLPGGPKDFEEWANMWMNWSYASFAENPADVGRQRWMDFFMISVINLAKGR
jgi:hypothetical protein